MLNRNTPDHSQSADKTNQAISPSDGEKFLKDMMQPVSKDAGFIVDKTTMSGVCDSNQHFQMSASAPPFHAAQTALDAEYATQFHMAGSLEAVNQTPSFLAADDKSSSQDKTTDH